MVLYRITLFPLAENIRSAYPELLVPFYSEDSVFGGMDREAANPPPGAGTGPGVLPGAVQVAIHLQLPFSGGGGEMSV